MYERAAAPRRSSTSTRACPRPLSFALSPSTVPSPRRLHSSTVPGPAPCFVPSCLSTSLERHHSKESMVRRMSGSPSYSLSPGAGNTFHNMRLTSRPATSSTTAVHIRLTRPGSHPHKSKHARYLVHAVPSANAVGHSEAVTRQRCTLDRCAWMVMQCLNVPQFRIGFPARAGEARKRADIDKTARRARTRSTEPRHRSRAVVSSPCVSPHRVSLDNLNWKLHIQMCSRTYRIAHQRI
jgi:hypothetical protein